MLGRALSLEKLSGKMLVWLTVWWSKMHKMCMLSIWYHCFPVIPCFVKTQNGLHRLSWEGGIEQVSVLLLCTLSLSAMAMVIDESSLCWLLLQWTVKAILVQLASRHACCRGSTQWHWSEWMRTLVNQYETAVAFAFAVNLVCCDTWINF